MTELLGYSASALIIASLTTNSMFRLRVIGLGGAAAFIIYGAMLGAWPVVTTNAVALSIHLFQLSRLARSTVAAEPSAAPEGLADLVLSEQRLQGA